MTRANDTDKDVCRVRYYTPRQVAELLQLTPQVIYEYIKAGKLPAIRLRTRYRISAEDLERFLEASKVTAGNEVTHEDETLVIRGRIGD